MQAANFSERDIKKLYKRFRALDTNQNGELDPHELFEVPEIADVSLLHTAHADDALGLKLHEATAVARFASGWLAVAHSAPAFALLI